jgi:hypothetical protein
VYTVVGGSPCVPGERLTLYSTASGDALHCSLTSRGGDSCGIGVITGGVASYWSATAPELPLPAWSWHIPLAVPLLVSGPVYRTESQPASPEVASLPANVNATGWLYQPL